MSGNKGLSTAELERMQAESRARHANKSVAVSPIIPKPVKRPLTPKPPKSIFAKQPDPVVVTTRKNIDFDKIAAAAAKIGDNSMTPKTNDKPAVPFHHSSSVAWVMEAADVMGGTYGDTVTGIVCTLALEAGKIDRHTKDNQPDAARGTLQIFLDSFITGVRLKHLYHTCGGDIVKLAAYAPALENDIVSAKHLDELSPTAVLLRVQDIHPDFGYKVA